MRSSSGPLSLAKLISTLCFLFIWFSYVNVCENWIQYKLFVESLKLPRVCSFFGKLQKTCHNQRED